MINETDYSQCSRKDICERKKKIEDWLENSQNVRYHADAPHVRRRAQGVVIDHLGS